MRRFDAEYFSKRVLTDIKALTAIRHQKISDFADVTDGIHTSIPFSEDGTVKVISAKHPKDNYFDLSNFECVSEEFHRANPRTALREDDVLISTVGTIGNSSVVDAEMLPANSDRHVGIIRILDDKINPLYLATFLNSKYGKVQSFRECTGNVQLNLFISKINTIIVPRFSEKFETAVSNTVLEARTLRKNGGELTKQAEALLLSALELEQWQPPEALTYERNAKEVFEAGRLDAQFFQSKYADLAEQLNATGRAVKLGSLLIRNDRGKQPIYALYGIPVVNSKHVMAGQVNISDDNRFSEESTGITIQNGDVVINGTGVGTIGRAAPYLNTADALPDNHVTVLRPKPNAIDPVYLSVFLNSKLGQMQVDQRLRGSSGQIELYPADIAQFLIWDAPEETQIAIREAVVNSFEAKQASTQLLEMAKRAVEMAIEESEAAALAYLESEGESGE